MAPLTPWTSPTLDVPHGFFGRNGGVSTGPFSTLNFALTKGDVPDAIAENTRRVERTFGPTARLVCAHQVHGDRVRVINEPEDLSADNQVDGLITKNPDLVLGVLSADCLPILLYDPRTGYVGAVHAGWRGAAQNIAGKAIQTLCTLGAHAPDIQAALGPAIQQNSFEVGPEVRDAFGPDFRTFFTPANDRFLCDLPGIVTQQLQHAGMKTVHSLGMDTYAAPDLFFSCRRATHKNEPTFGCQVSCISPRSHP